MSARIHVFAICCLPWKWSSVYYPETFLITYRKTRHYKPVDWFVTQHFDGEVVKKTSILRAAIEMRVAFIWTWCTCEGRHNLRWCVCYHTVTWLYMRVYIPPVFKIMPCKIMQLYEQYVFVLYSRKMLSSNFSLQLKDTIKDRLHFR